MGERGEVRGGAREKIKGQEGREVGKRGQEAKTGKL